MAFKLLDIAQDGDWLYLGLAGLLIALGGLSSGDPRDHREDRR